MYITQTGYAKQVRAVEVKNLKHIIDDDGIQEKYPLSEKLNVLLLAYAVIACAFLTAGCMIEFLYPSLIVLAAGMVWSGLLCWDNNRATKLINSTCWHVGQLHGWSIAYWICFLPITGYAFCVLVQAQQSGMIS